MRERERCKKLNAGGLHKTQTCKQQTWLVSLDNGGLSLLFDLFSLCDHLTKLNTLKCDWITRWVTSSRAEVKDAFVCVCVCVCVCRMTMAGQAKKMNDLLPDLPRGPLDVYRERASFNWKEMVLFLEGEDNLQFKVAMVSSGVHHWDVQTWKTTRTHC